MRFIQGGRNFVSRSWPAKQDTVGMADLSLRKRLLAGFHQVAIVGILLVNEFAVLNVEDKVSGEDSAPPDASKEQSLVEPVEFDAICAVADEGQLAKRVAVGGANQGRGGPRPVFLIVGLICVEPDRTLWRELLFSVVGNLQFGD